MFSDNLKYYRKQKKMTQCDLGEELYVSGRSVFNYESGERQMSVDTIPRLCEVLGVTPNQLFDFADTTLADFTTDELLAEIKRRIDYGSGEKL